MVDRTFGWVQNPSDIKSLQRVVQIFDAESAHYTKLRDKLVAAYIPIAGVRDSLQEKLDRGETTFSYHDLVGSSLGPNGHAAPRRPEAVADSLIQVTIPSQSAATKQKNWTDNWTADGYLRWAVSLNFVAYERQTDRYSITSWGLTFSRAESDEDFENILTEAFLKYPPATRVLSILGSSKHPLNKFELGHQLGFSGEQGFTSYSSDIMVEYLRQAEDKQEAGRIRADVEGTADKYARMISGWLKKVGLVESNGTSVVTEHLGTIAGFREYAITGRGLHYLRQSQGSSKNTKLSKFVMWEFFATAGSDRTYVRNRRSSILQVLMDSPRRTLNALLAALKDRGINENRAIIENDIEGLNNIGIRIESMGDYVTLKDSVEPFEIPNAYLPSRKQTDIDRTAEKAEFLSHTDIPARFVELLSIAHNPKSNRDFEIITAELFRDVYGLASVHLGNSKKPDALVFTDDFGIIVDTKAYSHGYSKSIGQEDEMVRYIEDNQQRSKTRNSNEWWLSFSPKIPEDAFHFLWVSSYFIGQFDDQLRETADRTGVSGGALDVRQLLLGASLVQKKQLDPFDLPGYMQNQQIQFTV
jgi:hypothetical protein